MDILDQAQNYEDKQRAESIANARQAVQKGPGRENCIICEELITPERRKAVPGCTLCIHCQRKIE